MIERGDVTGPSTIPEALGRLRVALDDSFLRTSRHFGLTPQQAELLCVARTPRAVGEVAALLRCDRSNVTRLVDRASRHDLMRRRDDEEDGRITVIELSDKGQRLADQFIRALEAQTDGLLAGWPGKRRKAAVELLTVIADTLDGARSGPPGRTARPDGEHPGPR